MGDESEGPDGRGVDDPVTVHHRSSGRRGVFDRPDNDITIDLRDRLDSARFAPDEHEVTFTVDRGIVTLEGTVLHPSDVPVVEALARSVDGVVAVEAHLKARAPEPTPT